MKKVVVDASCVIAVIADELPKEAIIEKTEGKHLISPSTLPFEIANALSRMFRRNLITLEQAQKMLEVYESIPIQLVDTIEIEDVIDTAHSLNMYAYDAYMVVCAVLHRSPLLTLDQQLQEKARRQGVLIIEV